MMSWYRGVKSSRSTWLNQGRVMGRKDPRARCFHLPPADPYENIPGHKPCGDAGQGKASMVVPALKLASYFDGIVTHFFYISLFLPSFPECICNHGDRTTGAAPRRVDGAWQQIGLWRGWETARRPVDEQALYVRVMYLPYNRTSVLFVLLEIY